MVSFHLFHKVAKLYKVLCLISCNHEKKFFDLFDRKTLCYTLNLNSNFYLGPSTATSISSFPSPFCAFFFSKNFDFVFFLNFAYTKNTTKSAIKFMTYYSENVSI